MDEMYSYPIYVCGMSSLLLDLAIGFLFFAQLNLLSLNLTTLESFIPGIIWRNPWKKDSFVESAEQICGKSSLFFPTRPFR
jgi:hypothetical protein